MTLNLYKTNNGIDLKIELRVKPNTAFVEVICKATICGGRWASRVDLDLILWSKPVLLGVNFLSFCIVRMYFIENKDDVRDLPTFSHNNVSIESEN